MSKKKHKEKGFEKDFWGTTAEDQLRDQDRFDEMEEKGEINLFSLGKIPKHYTGLESEITEDIARVFGNKESDSVEVDVPDNTYETEEEKASESFVASLKEDFEVDPEINYRPEKDEIVKEKPKKDIKEIEKEARKKAFKSPEAQKTVGEIKKKLMTKINFYVSGLTGTNILSLSDDVVSVSYKFTNKCRYTDDNAEVSFDDETTRKDVRKLIKYLIMFRHPTALYKFDEFEKIFDEIKGEFNSKNLENKFAFVDYNNYVSAYYIDTPLEADTFEGINDKYIMDAIVGLIVESLNANLAFTENDLDTFYNSPLNNRQKKAFIDLINDSIIHTNDVLYIDVTHYNSMFDKGEELLTKYVVMDDEDDENKVQYDGSDDEEINELINELTSDDDDEGDEEALSLDHEDHEFEGTPDDDTSDEFDNIDDLMEDAISEEEASEAEEEHKDIDKVAVNNPSKDNQNMTIPVTRKTHP